MSFSLTVATGVRKVGFQTMEFRLMAESRKQGSAGKPPRGAARRADKSPEWADGLRKLYDFVVEEPLPDSFDDLLKKLDQAGHG